jgi:hypothetical protein
MFLRHKLRRKDGKEHRYWSIVESRRVSSGRTVQRQLLYERSRGANQLVPPRLPCISLPN